MFCQLILPSYMGLAQHGLFCFLSLFHFLGLSLFAVHFLFLRLFLFHLCPALFGPKPLPTHQYFQPANSQDWTTEKQMSFFILLSKQYLFRRTIIYHMYIFIRLSIHKQQQLKEFHLYQMTTKQQKRYTAITTPIDN